MSSSSVRPFCSVPPSITIDIDESRLPLVLELVAQREDRETFKKLAEAIDWSCYLPEELVRAIQRAMGFDLYSLAAHLAEKGLQMFPQHDGVRRLSRVLAPPEVRKVPSSPVKGLSDSKLWIRENAHKYRGQWIAVREGRLLGAAQKLRELRPLIDENPSATIVTKVQ